MAEQDRGAIIQTLHTLTLPAPPSCVEFSRLLNHVFVVGTYNLDETEDQEPSFTNETRLQSRSGSLLLFHLQPNNEVTLVESFYTWSAVLDTKFSPHDPKFLATATSAGTIDMHLLTKTGDKLLRYRSVQVFDPSILILSLAWNPSSYFDTTIALTSSTGQVAITDRKILGQRVEPFIKASFDAHSLETWMVSWSPDGDEIYSGGDDSLVRRWDPHRQLEAIQDNEELLPGDRELRKNLIRAPPLLSIPGTLTDARTHGAGVTAILPLPGENLDRVNTIVTGSYDEFIRVLAPRSGRTWELLAERRLGGGVWRLKQLDFLDENAHYRIRILASCMHAGPRIVELEQIRGKWTIKVLGRVEDHESMNYGSDAVSDGRIGGYTVVSTSFYDRKLCVWKFPPG